MRSLVASSSGVGTRTELAGAVEASEVARVDAVGLDLPPGPSRDERGGHDVAVRPEGAQHPVGVEAQGPGLAAEHRVLRLEAPDELAVGLGRGGAHPVIGLRRPRSQDSHCRRLLVHIQSDMGTVVHGRFPPCVARLAAQCCEQST